VEPNADETAEITESAFFVGNFWFEVPFRLLFGRDLFSNLESFPVKERLEAEKKSKFATDFRPAVRLKRVTFFKTLN